MITYKDTVKDAKNAQRRAQYTARIRYEEKVSAAAREKVLFRINKELEMIWNK